MPEEQPGRQGVWCSNCAHDLSSEPRGEPCPRCGHPHRTYGVVQNATATGTASMSKTVGKTLSVVSKGVPSLEATWEEWQELRKRHPVWTAVQVGITFGPPVVGYFVDKTTGMLVGLLTGALSWWVGPKAVRTVPERVPKTLRMEGE